MNLIKVCLLQCEWHPLVKCCHVPLHFYSSTCTVLFYRSDYTYSCGIIWFVWTQTLQTVNSKNNETLSAFFPIRCFSSVQFSSVIQSCPTLCSPMNLSTPGLPVHHQLPEFTQTHVHRAGDAIQPSHPLSGPFPPAPNLSQHQGLFQWVSSSREVAKVLGVSASTSVLRMNTQDWSPLVWLVGSPCSARDSQESSPTPQFKSINSLALRFLYSPTLTSIHDHWKNHSLD